MQLRLEKASVSLANFMEDGLSTSQISLPTPALRHLERFRSFLHSFYVQRHGYWPPHIIQPNRGKSNPLPKHTLLTMYTDFRNLYEFIADTSTTPDTKLGDSVCGGSFSIIDYIISFSRRHKYSYLPFSLPHQPNVVPQFPAQPNLGTGRGMSLFSRLIGSKRDTIGRRMGLLAALQSATNVGDSKVMNSALVHEYARFEREYTLHEDDRLSHIDARNIRWLNIYSILQTLISVTQVPTEVIDIEGVDYPLCCQTAGTPPWKFNMLASEASSSTNVSSPTMASTVSDSSIETPPSRVSPSAQVPPLNLAAVASRRLSTLSTATKVAADQEAIFPHLVPLPITPSQNSTPEQHSDSATPRPLKTKSKSATPPPTIRTPSLARRLVNRSVPLSCPQPRRPVAEILINNYDPHDTSVVPAILAEHELEADHSGDSDAGSIYSNDGNTTETIHNPPSSSSTPTSSQHSPPSLQSSFDDSEPETPMTANFSTKSGAPYSTAATDSSPRIWDEANLLEEHRLSLPPMPTGDEDSKDRHDSTIGVISVTPGPLYMHGKPRKMQRKKSSELAQKFRQGIKWKEGPGWSWEADVLLRGAT